MIFGSISFEEGIGLLEFCKISSMTGLNALAESREPSTEDTVLLGVNHLPPIIVALDFVTWCWIQRTYLNVQFINKLCLAITIERN